MPLGSAVKSTINIDFTRAQGINSSGKILFQPPRVVVGTTVLSTRAVVATVADGVSTIELVRLPAGTYHVVEMIDGTEPYEWDFSLPIGAAGTIEYETIAAVSPVPAVYTYVRTVNGEPPDPVTGNVEVSGGGGSSTLNGLSDVTIVTPANNQALIYVSADTQWKNLALAVVALTGAWADITGKPSIPDSPDDIGAAPVVHTHTSGQITDFVASVDARIQLIIDSAPAALDTLNELAAALGDDPNFAGTVTTALAGKQPLNGHLTTISGLAPANNDFLQYIAGAWANRTIAQVKTSLAINNVDNTTDAQKPVSTAQQTALDLKANITDAVMKSILDAAGDIIVATGNDTPARLAKGADGTFLGVQSGSVGYFTPSGGGGDRMLYEPSADGALLEWTCDPGDCSADFPHNNQILLMQRFRWRGNTTTLSEIGFCVTSGASSPGAYSGVAIYEDGTGVVNRLGQSADAGVQWTTQGRKSIALSAPITTMVPGNYYRVASLFQGTPGRIAGKPLVILDALFNAGTRRGTVLTGQSSFPSTVTVSSMSTNNAVYWFSFK